MAEEPFQELHRPLSAETEPMVWVGRQEATLFQFAIEWIRALPRFNEYYEKVAEEQSSPITDRDVADHVLRTRLTILYERFVRFPGDTQPKVELFDFHHTRTFRWFAWERLCALNNQALDHLMEEATEANAAASAASSSSNADADLGVTPPTTDDEAAAGPEKPTPRQINDNKLWRIPMSVVLLVCYVRAIIAQAPKHWHISPNFLLFCKRFGSYSTLDHLAFWGVPANTSEQAGVSPPVCGAASFWLILANQYFRLHDPKVAPCACYVDARWLLGASQIYTRSEKVVLKSAQGVERTAYAVPPSALPHMLDRLYGIVMTEALDTYQMSRDNFA